MTAVSHILQNNDPEYLAEQQCAAVNTCSNCTAPCGWCAMADGSGLGVCSTACSTTPGECAILDEIRHMGTGVDKDGESTLQDGGGFDSTSYNRCAPPAPVLLLCGGAVRTPCARASACLRTESTDVCRWFWAAFVIIPFVMLLHFNACEDEEDDQRPDQYW